LRRRLFRKPSIVQMKWQAARRLRPLFQEKEAHD
jgi:hypothetical protein